MIDITKATATSIEQAVPGHLLLCWISGIRYRSIRVSGGLLCFDFPPVAGGHVEAAVYHPEPASDAPQRTQPTMCLNVGPAIVRWRDENIVHGRQNAAVGDVIVDQDGIAIFAKDPSGNFQRREDVKAWLLKDGQPQSVTSVSLVIRNWEIGVLGADREFVQFTTAGTARGAAAGPA